MYLSGEKSVEWIDNKNDKRVILLNIKLNALLLKQFLIKGIALLTKPFNSLFKKPADVNVVA